MSRGSQDGGPPGKAARLMSGSLTEPGPCHPGPASTVCPRYPTPRSHKAGDTDVAWTRGQEEEAGGCDAANCPEQDPPQFWER